MDKQSFEKHQKYVEFYKQHFQEKPAEEEFWGLGIENESYLAFQEKEQVPKSFIILNHKPERYSVNYWKNFKPKALSVALENLPNRIYVPTYINSYFFRYADLLGEHLTTYSATPKDNIRFSGETVDQFLRRTSPVFNTLMDKNMIYDGDTFEFTTFNFYKATVATTVKELRDIKKQFLDEMNKRLVSKLTIFKRTLAYPDHNYGFARFLSNLSNIAVCNNATYHINITLPTKLDSSGNIQNPEQFKAQHANAIRAIQWIEPLIVSLYGSPDILHALNPEYAQGSQRLAFSRYIGLGTYDTVAMEKGKLLDTFNHKTGETYFTGMHDHSPYAPPDTIGYDFNYNKFKNHGIEFRILDWFPEEHLEHVMNLLVLICQHSLLCPIPDPRENGAWKEFCAASIMKGYSAQVTPALYLKLYEVFGFATVTCWPFHFEKKPQLILERLAGYLYKKYRSADLCAKMSPKMKPIQIVNYNKQVRAIFRKMLEKN